MSSPGITVQEAQTRLLTGIPKEAEWSKGEMYGFYGPEPERISRVLYCVTPTEGVVEDFKKGGYNLLISHHPFSVRGIPQAIFHTALDCCPGGLNDQWREALQLQDAKHFDGTLGWHGKLPKPLTLPELVAECEQFIGTQVIGQVYERSPGSLIKTVVICTGLGGLVTELAAETGADCYILGEALSSADTMGFRSVIEIGHTLSEQMGVNLVRKLLGPDVQVDLARIPQDHFGGEVFAPRRLKTTA